MVSPSFFLGFFKSGRLQSSRPRTKKSFDSRHRHNIKISFFRQSAKLFVFLTKGFDCPYFLFIIYHYLSPNKKLFQHKWLKEQKLYSRDDPNFRVQFGCTLPSKDVKPSLRQVFRLICRSINTVMAVARDSDPISLLIYSAKAFQTVV